MQQFSEHYFFQCISVSSSLWNSPLCFELVFKTWRWCFIWTLFFFFFFSFIFCFIVVVILVSHLCSLLWYFWFCCKKRTLLNLKPQIYLTTVNSVQNENLLLHIQRHPWLESWLQTMLHLFHVPFFWHTVPTIKLSANKIMICIRYVNINMLCIMFYTESHGSA